VIGDPDAAVAVVSWGSTWGAVTAARRRLEAAGHRLAHIHLRHLNPLPANLGELLSGFERVIVPEMNTGQLSRMLRAEYLVDARAVTKITGQPFTAAELIEALWPDIAATSGISSDQELAAMTTSGGNDSQNDSQTGAQQ